MTSMILTGAPGVGKTTILMDVAQKLKARGVRVGGVVSREVITNNIRTGFEFIDLATNDGDVLASDPKDVEIALSTAGGL